MQDVVVEYIRRNPGKSAAQIALATNQHIGLLSARLLRLVQVGTLTRKDEDTGRVYFHTKAPRQRWSSRAPRRLVAAEMLATTSEPQDGRPTPP